MTTIRQAVILAGGLGTRLRPITDRLPKPLTPVNGRPFLEYIVESLKKNAIQEIVLLLGYKAGMVVAHFGDGSKFGVKIKYSIGEPEFDTGKRIKDAQDLLDETFLLMYCDNYWPLDLEKLEKRYYSSGLEAQVVAYKRPVQEGKNNIAVKDGKVTAYDKSRTAAGLEYVDIGFFLLKKSIVGEMPEGNCSFEEKVLPRLAGRGQLGAFTTGQPYASISSLERLAQAGKFLDPERKVVFLDRDGVINAKAPEGDYVKDWAEFRFLPGAKEAVKKLWENGFELFIISNQASIARGVMTRAQADGINEKMCDELLPAKITGIYLCPHGYDEGCDCRKPKPGLLYAAARAHSIDLTKATLIGDDMRDIAAGKQVGSRTILIGSGNRPMPGILPDRRCAGLARAAGLLVAAGNEGAGQ